MNLKNIYLKLRIFLNLLEYEFNKKKYLLNKYIRFNNKSIITFQ